MTTTFDRLPSRISRFALVSALVWLAGPRTASAALNPGDIVIATQIGPSANNDYGLVVVDPTTGNRTVLSDNTVGAGPDFATPEGVAIEPDGNLLVADLRGGPGGYSAIFRIDPATGNRTIVSSNGGIGTGVSMQQPYGIIETGNTIYVADAHVVLAIDPVSGNRTTFSSARNFLEPIGIALQGNALLVTDYLLGAVFHVDLATGNVTAPNVGTFPAIPEYAAGIAVGPTGTIYVVGQIDGQFVNNYAGVFAQDPVTHMSSMLSTNIVGSGPLFGNFGPTGIATEANGTILLNEATLNAVLAIDPVTGNRTILSDATRGTGPSITAPQGVLVIPNVPEPATIVLAAIAGLLLVASCRCGEMMNDEC